MLVPFPERSHGSFPPFPRGDSGGFFDRPSTSPSPSLKRRGARSGTTFLETALGNKSRLARAVGAVVLTCLVAPATLHAGEEAVDEKVNAEKKMFERIEQLSASLRADLPFQIRLTFNAAQLREIVSVSNDFLKLYPMSSTRDRTLVAKLAALAELSRMRPEYLEQLLTLTREISSGQPAEPLASECAFYSIQSFVLAARREGITRDRRMRGTMERYRAFLDDHPRSRWRPIVRASLVRNLLATHRTKEAEGEVNLLKREFPQHPATKRARGELFRVTAVGKPFERQLRDADGTVVNTADFKGKVVVLHFWSSTSSFAIDGLEILRKLHSSFQEKGLILIGVNVDPDRSTFEQTLNALKLPWRQHYVSGGIASEILVQWGVIRLPTYFVIDRRGVLRYTESGKTPRESVVELLAEKGASPKSRAPG